MLKDYLAISSLPFVDKSLDEFLEYVRNKDLYCIEIVLEMYDKEEIMKLKNEDFKILAHAPWYDVNIGHLNENLRKCSVKVIKESIKTCYEIGCEILTVHSGRVSSITYGKRYNVLNKTIDSLREIVEYAKNYNVFICLENAANIIDSTCIKFEEFNYVLENVKDLYVTLDLGHAITSGDFDMYKKFLKDYRLKNIHIHDNNGRYDEHLAIGDGVLKKFINEIIDAYKNGTFYLTIEVSKIEYIERSLEFLKKYL